MSDGKVLQIFDKQELECDICQGIYKNPKKLRCRHSYCLQCLINMADTEEKISCPKCRQTYEDLKKEDLKNLTSDNMIINQVEKVEKIESEKPLICSTCENKPTIFCSDCQLYICGICIKHHKILPTLKEHSLYKLERDDKNCQTHNEYVVEFFCRNCNKIGCKKCEHVVRCYQNKHDVIPMKTAVNEFNENVAEAIKTIDIINDKLRTTLDTSTKESSKFGTQLNFCRAEIGIQEKQITKKVKEKNKKMMEDLEEINIRNQETVEEVVNNILSKLTDINQISITLNTLTNKPEETETLRSQKAIINDIKDKVESEQLSIKQSIQPTFIPHTHLYDIINTEGIGIIRNANCVYKVAEDDKSITVTKGQPFVVKVFSMGENDEYILAGTLINTSGEESATEVEDLGNGEYRIKGKCNMVGNWQMAITAGVAHITGSPVNIKVEELGLVRTIGNIAKYRENEKDNNVTDITVHADGGILVSNCSKNILMFNQSGSFTDKVPGNIHVSNMYQMADGCMAYSNYAKTGKRVVMCDKNFQEIRSFDEENLKEPAGLTVNEATRIMYVAEYTTSCVFKFNVDDGRFLGKIGSEGSEEGQMLVPESVTLTKDGHVIVADSKSNRILMFDANDTFMRTIVESGDDDGHVLSPFSVITDDEENILVSSNHKIQLFDKNGVFIKRIDKDDGINDPAGVSVISHRPRRVAVANYGENNVKIFNY